MKQKAKELSDKFKEITHDNKEITLMSLRLRKKCALICVDEILYMLKNLLMTPEKSIAYQTYLEIKQEIKKP